MKRRTYPEQRSGQSPYSRYNKREFDYSSMYARNPHLKARPANSNPTVGLPRDVDPSV